MTLCEIGATGERVHRVGFGSMALGYPARPDVSDAVRILCRLADAGSVYLDTADVYCKHERELGYAESLISRASARHGVLRRRLVVGTKGGLIRTGSGFGIDASPVHLRAACEASLRRLSTECVFLYFLHAFDDRFPIEDSVGELSRLQEEGKILHIGVSNVCADRLRRATRVARVEAVQNKFNPLHKWDLTDGIIDYCEEHRITYMAYSPFGGKKNGGHRRLMSHPIVRRLAAHHGFSPYQLVVAWLLGQSPRVLPIPSATRLEDVSANLEAAAISLTRSSASVLDAIEDDDAFSGWLTNRRGRRRWPEREGSSASGLGRLGERSPT